MAKQASTPKQSSGGGYDFEDIVVAYFLVQLLGRTNPFTRPQGTIERIETQRPASEWHLDDLLITINSEGKSYRISFSIKSNQQITNTSLPKDFIKDTWQQLLHDSSDVFDEKKDFLGIITSPLDSDLRKNVNELLRLSREQDPKDLAYQVNIPNRVNDQIRSFYDSATCPKELAEKHEVEIDSSPGRLLRRLICRQFDFEDIDSKDSSQAIDKCQALLISGSNEEARSLWTQLQVIANRIGRGAGYTDLNRLVDEIRGQFNLKDFPDHSQDWEKVKEYSISTIDRIQSKIGGKASLTQEKYHDAINHLLESNKSAILLGSSGIGKSVLAKHQAQKFSKHGKVLWFDPELLISRTLSEWRMHLGLNNTLANLLTATPTTDALLVLDGVDKLHKSSGFATISELLKACNFGYENSPWKIILTCTPDEWTRVRAELISHGISVPNNAILSIEYPTPTDLEEVWDNFPQLLPLSDKIHLSSILFRPKVLDLLATSSTVDDTFTNIGESYIVNLFWQKFLAIGTNSISRVTVAKKIAQYFADNLQYEIAVSLIDQQIDSVNTQLIDELVQDRILKRYNSRISFEHELYADWVRAILLQDLFESGELVKYLRNRIESPVWHRAIRLLGINLLESQDDFSSWQECFHSFDDLPDHFSTIAQDIFLEATAFATAGGVGLLNEELWELLIDKEKRYLNRLLKKLFHSATFPNEQFVDFISEEAPELSIYLASKSRVPYWPYWYGIINFLHQYRSQIPASDRGLVARFIDLWLRITPFDYPLRDKASEIAVEMGDNLLAEKEQDRYLFQKGKNDQLVYRSVIAAGHEEPDRVTQILLEASGRRDQRFLPKLDKSDSPKTKKPFPLSTNLFGSLGPISEPWQHGPKFRVDGAIQELIFTEPDALNPLFKVIPEIAGEVILANLISEPKRSRSYYDDIREQFHLEWPKWNPEFYTRGPFLNFLRTSEDDAISTIINLVEHATERWGDSYKRRIARDKNLPIKALSAPTIKIEVNGEEHEYLGNRSVFNWVIYGPDKGHIVGSALKALEKYLYDLADEEVDLEPLISRLLQNCKSLAIIGLLSLVGRRHPQYFISCLKGLLGSPHLLSWTISGNVSHTWQMPISFGLVNETGLFGKKLREWHEMPHRKISLVGLAQFFFLNDPELQRFFKEAREKWIEKSSQEGNYEGLNFIENFIAKFELENYELVEVKDGTKYYQYSVPDSLQERNEEQEIGAKDNITLMSLPVTCQKILEKEDEVKENVLNNLWDNKKQVQQVLDGEKEYYFSKPSSALVAVASVIILKGESWGNKYPERIKWARELLIKTAVEFTEDQESFLSEMDDLRFASTAIPVIWSEELNEIEIRKAVARIIFHTNSEVVGNLTFSTATVHDRLGDDHLRVIHAVLYRSKYVFELQNLLSQQSFNNFDDEKTKLNSLDRRIEGIKNNLSSLEKKFIDGTLETSIPTLNDLAPFHSSRYNSNIGGHRYSIPSRAIDEGFLIAAYKAIPNPLKGNSYRWLVVWKKTIEQSLSKLDSPEETDSFSEPDGHPSSWDNYILERIAFIITQLKDQESSRQLWRPILEQGISATDWIIWFLKHWTSYSLHPKASEHVISTWLSMIEYANTNIKWSKFTTGTYSEYRIGELWRSLLGLQGFSKYNEDVWNKDLKLIVSRLTPFLEEWSSIHLCNPSNVSYFANFLTYPALTDLVLEGLKWLYTASNKYDERFWITSSRQSNSDQAVFSLLNYIWKKKRNELRKDPEAFAAFRGLLGLQVSRQYQPAMELSVRIGSFK